MPHRFQRQRIKIWPAFSPLPNKGCVEGKVLTTSYPSTRESTTSTIFARLSLVKLGDSLTTRDFLDSRQTSSSSSNAQNKSLKGSGSSNVLPSVVLGQLRFKAV